MAKSTKTLLINALICMLLLIGGLACIYSVDKVLPFDVKELIKKIKSKDRTEYPISGKEVCILDLEKDLLALDIIKAKLKAYNNLILEVNKYTR